MKVGSLYIDKKQGSINVEGQELLIKIGIYADVNHCLNEYGYEALTNYSFITENKSVYIFTLIKESNSQNEYMIYNVKTQWRNKKKKYSKIEMKKKQVTKIVHNIGRKNAQLVHSEDLEVETMISLRNFLKEHQDPFEKKKLYYKNYKGEFREHRFKNLFSKNVDEISDCIGSV